MKKEIISSEELENKLTYISPKMQIVEINVEKGFAASPRPPGDEDDEDEGL